MIVANEAVETLTHNYQHQLAEAVDSEHRRLGDDEDILANTNQAVRAAKALELLTGVDWEEHLVTQTEVETPPESP